MLEIAKQKESSKLSFKLALSNSIADIVICSQAFHWMEPVSTITEVSRILKSGGIFAVIDADYPPIIDIRLEKLNRGLHKITYTLEKEHAKQYLKKNHFDNLNLSNQFDYVRQIGFLTEISYTKETFKKFLLSQSSMKKAITENFHKIKAITQNLDDTLDSVFKGNTLDGYISYKMIIGVKNQPNIE